PVSEYVMADGLPVACTWKLPAKVATNVVLFALVNVGADGGSGVGATTTPWKTMLAPAVAIGVKLERPVPLPVIGFRRPLESAIWGGGPERAGGDIEGGGGAADRAGDADRLIEAGVAGQRAFRDPRAAVE